LNEREMRRGDAADAREPLHGPGLVRSGIHAIFRAQQAAQQLGVLDRHARSEHGGPVDVEMKTIGLEE
jgi:hypothetical protein